MKTTLLSVILALASATLSAQIPMSDFVSTYSHTTHTRGFYFQAPVPFMVVALQVPDETNAGVQNVALYRTAADPTTLGSINPIFIQTGVPSDQLVMLRPPEMFQAGEWMGVLGACGTATMANSYGDRTAPPYPSRVLGAPIGLMRLMLQQNIATSGGTGSMFTNTASFSRVRVFVAGQGEARPYGAGGGLNPPILAVSDPNPPSIGFPGGMRLLPGAPANLGGVLLLGLSQSNLPSPFGPLLNQPMVTSLFVPGPIPSTGQLVTLPIPQDANLLGLGIFFQHAEIQGTSASLGNGLSWRLGR